MSKYQNYLDWLKLSCDCDRDYESVKALQELIDKSTPKFVLCPKGFQGIRYTRYYCPNCGKIVKNGDEHCHRCGQNIRLPKIKFSNNKAYLDWSDEDD